ncbi:endonuclease III-like protein 1 [Drosophila elegans]|uniref:endonuclease III-like protein 1 n=1 Tax=Drosophila elegans TaxID=30023 RepID=UPI001BC8670F|nr:endonuclease III-like protein 1 [Drosophila elegans]
MNTRRAKFILNMAKNVKKLTLASKLVKRGDIIEPTEIISRQSRTDNLRDIEDLVGAGSSNSIYFSPVQARKQRLLNGETPKKTNIKLEALTPTRVPPKKNKKDDQLVTKTQVGTATVVKCKLMPDSVDSPLRIDKIKQELEPQIKQELITQDNQEGLVNIKKEPDPTVEPSLYIEVDSPNPLWYYHLESIRVMRNSKSAPVDIMGCHRCADSKADAKTQRFQNLVALMLSSQTKDQTTYEAMNRLKDQNLTPLKIKEMPVTELENLLHPVSFYKNKAKYLKQTVDILIEKYDSDIPDNPKELIALPGVGPKMAHICMAVAWNKVTGIGVDVHVHRISNRLGWLPKPTKEPEQTRIALEKWLPHSLWAEVNHLFVGFGQTICTPVKPNCGECLNKDICPSANAEAKQKKKKE